MQDLPNEGLPLFPEAAECYCPPNLFAEWKALKAQIPPIDQRGWEWSPFFHGDTTGPQELNLAQGFGRPLTEREGALQYNVNLNQGPTVRYPQRERAQAILAAEGASRRALLQDLIGRLRSGQLVARGNFYEHGKPVRSGDVSPWLWDDWRERSGYGERIRFGDYSAKFEVRRLRVFKPHAVIETPAQADGERELAEPLLRRGEVERAAILLLEAHQTELVKTNGLLAAAEKIKGMLKVEKSVTAGTVRKYITVRFWELAAEMGVEPSPTSPKSKPPR